MGDSNPAKDLLLAVLPWPEEEARDAVKEIEKEFPELEVQYFFERHAENEKERGKFQVPKGRSDFRYRLDGGEEKDKL